MEILRKVLVAAEDVIHAIKATIANDTSGTFHSTRSIQSTIVIRWTPPTSLTPFPFGICTQFRTAACDPVPTAQHVQKNKIAKMTWLYLIYISCATRLPVSRMWSAYLPIFVPVCACLRCSQKPRIPISRSGNSPGFCCFLCAVDFILRFTL